MSTDPKPTKPSPSPVAPPSPFAAPSHEQSSPSPVAARSRRFKHRELDLADGGKLVLKADGSISQVDDAGTTTHTWEPADPEWASHAIRFGLFPQDATVAPTGRYLDDRRPPRR